MALIVDRVASPRGELALRRDGEHFEVISNGVFLMDTRNGESERLLVRAALSHVGKAALPPISGPDSADLAGVKRLCLLIGGLGVGFSLVAALADDRVGRVVVVEIEPAIVGWHRDHLSHLTAAALADPRTEVVVADLRDYLRAHETRFDAICLDVDNGPDWTVTESNLELYGAPATSLLASRLLPGGVLTVWSAAGSAAYEQVLRKHFGNVDVMEIPVPRGDPDAVFVASQPVAQTQGRDSDRS
jgi:spermidine synthase